MNQILLKLHLGTLRNGLSLRQSLVSTIHMVSTLPPALLISVAQGSALDQQRRIQTHEALAREYSLQLPAIHVLSKAQLRKAIFTKDYLKDKQFIHSSKHSKFHPWINLPTSQLHTRAILL